VLYRYAYVIQLCDMTLAYNRTMLDCLGWHANLPRRPEVFVAFPRRLSIALPGAFDWHD